jgi:hypothetical protein
MDTDKMKQVAYETVIANEDELFAASDKTQLAMGAAMVLRHMPELLAKVTKTTAQLAIEAADDVDEDKDGDEAYSQWHKLFASRLKKDSDMDELLNALNFTSRYVEQLGEVAARKAIADESSENFGAKFGRN